MSWEAWLTLAVVAATVFVLARDLVQPAIAVVGATIALLISGVITTEQAFAGFSNAAPMTVAALFVVAKAVEKTGALQPLLDWTLRNGDGQRRGLLRLLVPTAGASAVLNNTPIVAMLAPQVADWAEKRGKSASLFLMPLSFAVILGGTVTVIGTSTNLVVSGLMEASGQAPIGMFEIARVGLPVAVVGLAVIILLAPVLLPDRRPARQQFEQNLREYVVNTVVTRGGPLDGVTVEQGGLRDLQGVFLAEVQRGEEAIAPVAPTTLLHGGDRLSFVGRVDLVRDLQRTRGLQSAEYQHTNGLNGSRHTFFELVVSGTSPLVGKTLKQTDFRSGYQAAVVAIHRAGERVNAKLGSVPLKEGDTLLALSDHGFGKRWRDRGDFLLISRLGGSPPPSSRQAAFAQLITLLIVVVAGAGLLPILHASLLAAVILVVSGILTAGEARAAIDLDVLLVIAASFGLGAAIQTSGLTQWAGVGVVEGFGRWGPTGILVGVVIISMVLTELITNNAAAVLVFPIAMAAAAEFGLDPRPFAIALAIAASSSYLTPIGYQTNTMVYGLGGYRFGDYARLGFPLTLLVILTTVLLVPIFWPF